MSIAVLIAVAALTGAQAEDASASVLVDTSATPLTETASQAELSGGRGAQLRERLEEMPSVSPFGRLAFALILAGGFIALGRAAGRARKRLNETGILPRLLVTIGRLAGGIAGLLVAWGGLALLPSVAPEILWGTLAAGAGLLVVGAWGVLPDVFAGAVLFLERRVQPGLRIEGEGFAGTVIRTTWRSTWLRTPRGRLEIPNRILLAGPTRVSRAAEHELTLELESRAPASVVRQRIEDAVLASAYTPPRPHLRVHRDPRHPGRWVVHTRLLHPRFAPAFDADLPSRVGEIQLSLSTPSPFV